MSSRRADLENAIKNWLEAEERPEWATPFSVKLDADPKVQREELTTAEDGIVLTITTDEITTKGIVANWRLDEHTLILSILCDEVTDEASLLAEQLIQRLQSLDFDAAGRIRAIVPGEPLRKETARTQDVSEYSLILHCEVFA